MGAGVWMRCWLLVSGTGLGWQQGGDTQPGGLQRVRGDRDVAADSQPEVVSPGAGVIAPSCARGLFVAAGGAGAHLSAAGRPHSAPQTRLFPLEHPAPTC